MIVANCDHQCNESVVKNYSRPCLHFWCTPPLKSWIHLMSTPKMGGGGFKCPLLYIRWHQLFLGNSLDMDVILSSIPFPHYQGPDLLLCGDQPPQQLLGYCVASSLALLALYRIRRGRAWYILFMCWTWLGMVGRGLCLVHPEVKELACGSGRLQQ